MATGDGNCMLETTFVDQRAVSGVAAGAEGIKHLESKKQCCACVTSSLEVGREVRVPIALESAGFWSGIWKRAGALCFFALCINYMCWCAYVLVSSCVSP